jgi:hypothetical protein
MTGKVTVKKNRICSTLKARIQVGVNVETQLAASPARCSDVVRLDLRRGTPRLYRSFFGVIRVSGGWLN